MARHLILGTAGHIDHGKTSLVKALTGIDCDRLPEEKARGITIDIGFAALDLGDFHLGLVDVPGHEKFIKNMLAGATGIDLALLVVAADDGIMPQTREHFEILQLLGLRHGVVALTKADLVDETTREVVALELREFLAGSTLADAPIVITSANTGLGLEELKKELINTCRRRIETNADLIANDFPFRMAIDRAFVVQGHGTVVTGSVASGSAQIGDELAWLPSGRTVRVRSLQNHEQPVQQISRGMRAAINLAGVDLNDVQRGQELAAPGYLQPSRTLTVYLKTAGDARRPLKHRMPIRLHIGTAEVMGSLTLLESDSLPANVWAFGQLFLDEPVVAVWGQPFVLRDSAAQATIGGGRVMQPVGRKIRRSDAPAIVNVRALNSENSVERIEAVANSHLFSGFTDMDLIREAGVSAASVPDLIKQLIDAKKLMPAPNAPQRLMTVHAIATLEHRILEVLGRMHAEQPLLTSHDRGKVLAQLEYLHDSNLVASVIEQLVSRKKLIGDGHRIARADFKPRLSVNQRKLKDAIVAAHNLNPFQPPDPASFANQAGGQASHLKDIYEVAVAEGLLVKISDAIYLSAAAAADMKNRVVARLQQGGPGLTVAAIRDMLGTTRKFAVPLCEYLDRSGVTQRQGDFRILAQESVAANE
jgi:selenocysteine-specific elongation factor